MLDQPVETSGVVDAVTLTPLKESIDLRGVSFTYPGGGAPALNNVSLSIAKGETVAIVGPNGCGKTTLVSLLPRLFDPDSGEIRYDGVEIRDASLSSLRRQIGVVSQDAIVFAGTPLENIAYGQANVDRARAEDAARRAYADEFIRNLPGGYEAVLGERGTTLSGGQRQRVALARALIARPTVVLLDEPLGALDLQLREQMQSVLKRLQREVGITFIYVTHDQGEALSMSDRLAVMHDGTVQQIGTPEEVYYRPETRFVAGFIGHSNLIDCQIRRAARGYEARLGSVVLRLAGEHEERAATVAVRWEAIEIGGADSATEDQLTASVEAVVFHGQTHEIALRIDRLRLTALVPARRVVNFERGQVVKVAIDPADVVVLRD
ncbi:MAG: ABC transporter ATP-binding protein [Planctomycetes bacterium]|nr:ABC transporter ATP-binding protein [Planctomycetota bacterium]